MVTFTSYDGTRLAYEVCGDGEPLLCVPGGPGRSGQYLENLGGLDAHSRLVVLDNRGTGGSAIPADAATYRADRLVDDVEAWRVHLGLDRIDLLGHSAGAQVACLYAAAHPERIRRLLLIAGGQQTVGAVIDGAFVGQAEARAATDPGDADALPALKALLHAETAEEALVHLPAAGRLFYGHPWSTEAQAHFARGLGQRNEDAADGYGTGLALDVPAIRASLAALDVPVLVYAGELDMAPTVAEATVLAEAFPHAQLVVQPNAGHYPWVDDAESFRAAVHAFLAQE